MYVYATFSLYTHLSVDIWVAFNSWLQWVKPQQSSWVCKYLLEILFSLLLNIYPELGWLDHMVVLFCFFWGTSTIFYSCCMILHPHQQHMGSNLRILVILHIVFWVMVTLLCVRWYLMVVLICIFLISDDEHLLMYTLDFLKKFLFSAFFHFCSDYLRVFVLFAIDLYDFYIYFGY